MSPKEKDALSQESEDALINMLMGKAVDNGSYDDLMTGARRAGIGQRVEDAMERHAARRRAAGEKGW